MIINFTSNVLWCARIMSVEEIEREQTDNNYIIELPQEFEPDERGLGYMYFQYMKKYKDRIGQYIVNTKEEDHYKDLLQRVIRTALELKKRDIQKSDVVSLCTYNHKNSSVPFIASTFLGIPVASFDPTLSAMDTAHLMNEVKPKIVFVVPEALDLIEASLEETGFEAEIVVFDDTVDSEKYTNYSDFLQYHDEEDYFIPEPISNLRETAVILFSSGTTGLPKGIMISHYAIIYQSISFMNSGNLGAVSLSYASLYWISSILFSTATIFTGAARVICSAFDARTLWHIIEEYKITFLALVPAHVVNVIKSGRPDGCNTTSLVSCIVGGMSLSEKLMRDLRDLLPGTFVSMAYGQSEVAGLLTFFQIKYVKHTLLLHYKPESVGMPIPGILYKVVDPETHQICGPNENGELRVKTKLIMNGYYGRDSSESFDSDGWLRTGDIVYYDQEHCFFIVDRIKEMLKYKYWHVAPAVVEKVICNHPSVETAVVIGIPHEDGDHPMALIILKRDYWNAVTPEEIIDFVSAKAPDRMRLRGGVKFIQNIPLTPSGKVKRKDIKDMVLNGLI